MNRCRFIKELSGYADNQLSEKRRIQIEEHLKHCACCIQELEKLKALSEKLKSWQAPVLDASFDSSVKNKIVALELAKETGKMKSKTLSILIPSGAVAGILIVSLLSLQMYMKGNILGKRKMEIDGIGSQYEPYYAESEYKSDLARSRSVGKKIKEGLGNTGYSRGDQDKRLAKDVNRSVAHQESSQRIYDGPVIMYSKMPSSRSRMMSTETKEDNDGVAGSNTGSESLRAWTLSEDMYVAGASNFTPSTNKRDTYVTSSLGGGSVIVIQPMLPATGVGDMIIRTAELALEVENGKETYGKITDICREFGGYLAESSFSKNDQGREAGRVTLRIPKDKFLLALDKLSELGKVKANNTHSQDVSQEYANLKAELDAAMVVYNKMLEALQKRQTSIPEAMRLESELTPVLKKIENLKNQIEKLNNLTSFTTIIVNFYEAEVSAKVLDETKKLVKENILAAKINAVRYFATHLPLVGLVAGFTIAAFIFVILLSIFIARLRKRG